MWFHVTDPADPAPVEAVLAAAEHARPPRGSVTIIGIDGFSGSGKTTLAAQVSTALHAPVVHMDDLFPGWDGLADAVGLLVTQVLEPLARGERAAYRRWDWHQNDWADRIEVPETDLLIIEGCGSTVGPAGDYAAVRVFMEAPREERMRRGIERDGETYRPHWERWAAQESALFAEHRTRERAHLIIATG